MTQRDKSPGPWIEHMACPVNVLVTASPKSFDHRKRRCKREQLIILFDDAENMAGREARVLQREVERPLTFDR